MTDETVAALPEPEEVVKRLRDTPNWMKEQWNVDWKANVSKYDRTPFEAADLLTHQAAEIAELKKDLRKEKDLCRKYLCIAGAFGSGTDEVERIATKCLSPYEASAESYKVQRVRQDDTIEACLKPLRSRVQEMEKDAQRYRWKQIDDDTPRDNKQMLMLAKFVDGKLQQLDFDGIWDSETDGWENGNNISYFWASANGIEDPTHWMYQINAAIDQAIKEPT